MHPRHLRDRARELFRDGMRVSQVARELDLHYRTVLVRGLFHSDGCRSTNRIHKDGKSYAYPRYFFSNRSEGVLDICRSALDRVGVEGRMARPDSLSIARRAAVAVAELDRWVEPKG
jgi:hypothetical protein